MSDLLQLTTLVITPWILISSAEWIKNYTLYGSNGLQPSHILISRLRAIPSSRVHAFLHHDRYLGYLLAVRILAGLVLPFASTSLLSFLCLLLFSTGCALFYRFPFGGNGSDQMGQCVLLGLMIASAGRVGDVTQLEFIGFCAIAAQSVLAYMTSGISKLFSQRWRSGEALCAVMNTTSYGNRWVASLLSQSPNLSVAICWLIILTESMFFLVLLVPRDHALIMLAVAAAFHVLNAVIMGLNSFVPTFLATYPSLLAVHAAVQSVMASIGVV